MRVTRHMNNKLHTDSHSPRNHAIPLGIGTSACTAVWVEQLGRAVFDTDTDRKVRMSYSKDLRLWGR